MTYRSDKRIYLNADRTKAVSEGSPDAAYLLVPEGGEISDDEAERYGLRKASKSAAKAVEEPQGDKEIKAPQANKQRAPRARKAQG